MYTVKWAASLLCLTLCSTSPATEIAIEPSATEVVAVPSESVAEENEIPKKKSESVVLTADDAAALKSIRVFISLEQKKPIQATVPSPFILVPPDPITGAINWGAILVAGLVSSGIHAHAHGKASGLLPEYRQKTRTAPHFRKVKLKKGVFVQSVNQTVASPFEGETWFENVEISMMSRKMTKTIFQAQLEKLQKKGALPDAVAIMRNQFLFGPDLCKLWFTTDVEIYRILNSKSMGVIPMRPVYRERFISLHNLRDHFDIVEPEDPWDKDKYIAGFWTKDNGKLYYETVTQLASENAKIIKNFLLDQPPHTLATKKHDAAIMALYEIKPEAGEPEESKKKPTPEQERRAAIKLERKKLKERKADGRIMEELNPVQRKVYMLGKEHEYVRLVEIIETASDRTILRDQDNGFYYSFPNKNMKLVMQNQLDANEYAQIVLEYREQERKKSYKKTREFRSSDNQGTE
jgi:hypothetical protein